MKAVASSRKFCLYQYRRFFVETLSDASRWTTLSQRFKSSDVRAEQANQSYQKISRHFKNLNEKESRFGAAVSEANQQVAAECWWQPGSSVETTRHD